MARKKFNLGAAKPKEADWKAQLTAPTKEVSISEIITDPKLQHRAMMNQEAIADYAQVLTGGGQLAPVKLMETPDGKKYLYDGYHTLEAALASGRQTLKATIKRGTWREAWLESLGVNHDHGVRRSISDKRKAVDDALSDPDIRDSIMVEDGKWSFRKVAKYTKTTHPFVSRRWERMYPPEPMSDESSVSDLADSQNSEPAQGYGGNIVTHPQVGQVRATPDEDGNVSTHLQVGQVRATPDEDGNVSTHPQVGQVRVTPDEDGNVSTHPQVGEVNTAPNEDGNVSAYAESSEPKKTHDIASSAKSKITPRDEQINEIISLANYAGVDVISLNEAQFTKVNNELSLGKEYKKLDETIIILRFPHFSR